MNSAFCSHLTNLSRIMSSCISRALTFGKCDVILLHPKYAKYLLLLPTSSHILKHFPCISRWLHCSIVATSQVSTSKLELVCNCKWQENLTKFQFFAKKWEGKQKHSKLKPKNLQISTWIGTNFLGEFARILTVQTHPTKVRHYRTWRTQLSNSHIVQEQRTL